MKKSVHSYCIPKLVVVLFNYSLFFQETFLNLFLHMPVGFWPTERLGILKIFLTSNVTSNECIAGDGEIPERSVIQVSA